MDVGLISIGENQNIAKYITQDLANREGPEPASSYEGGQLYVTRAPTFPVAIAFIGSSAGAALNTARLK